MISNASFICVYFYHSGNCLLMKMDQREHWMENSFEKCYYYNYVY